MRIKWVAGLLAACAALAGCSTQTNVSMGTSVQAKYSHVWLTIQEVWFNTSATASPEDSGWKRFTLSAPITLDLATLSSGTLEPIATSLKVAAGTYSQLRLIPVDPSAALTASATAAGAKYNAEADYTDASGNAQQAPLELLNPEKGIGVSTTLTVKASLAQLGSLTSASTTGCITGTEAACSSGTTCADGTSDCTPATTTGASCTADQVDCMSPSGTACVSGENDCTTAASTTTTTAATSSSATMSVAVTVDGIHDLVQFAYGDANNQQIGVLLNPHSSAYDVSTAGGIRGTVDLTNVTADSSGHYDVQATAETLSTDGTRHVAVQSVQVGSDGSFVLYPLPAATSSTTDSTGLTTTSSSTTTYDLVIHGPRIATVIVKSIPVAAGDPSTSVSIGTVTPRAANDYTFNMAAGTVALPAGALVDLYQTIPASGEVPYVVDQVPIDPFSRTLLYDEAVPTGTIDWGTYVSGGNVALTSVTPMQGQSVYFVSAQAPSFTDEEQLVTTLGPPASGTGPVPIAMPTLSPAAGSGSVSMTVAPVTAGKYDRGELILSHDGAIVQTVAIDTALTQNGGATLTVQGIPAGGSASSFDNAVYYVSTRAWNSSDPAGTLQRQSFTTPIDLSSGSATGPTVNVD